MPPLRRPFERTLAGGLAAEGQRREQVGADVQGQDLQHAQRQREAAAGERPNNERGELSDVVRQVVSQEPPDIRVRGAALLHCGDDGGKVVIQEHEVRRLTGYVRAAQPHGYADVCLLEGRAVVDAVAGHRHHVALALEQARHPEFLFGRDPADHHTVAVQQGGQHGVVLRQGVSLQDQLG
ncbi:hypothetical protein D9M72_385750 [compost metagenome]